MDVPTYSGDLTDEEWNAIEPLIPLPKHGGRKRRLDMRRVVNAIRYVLQTNCGWRHLPRRFPSSSSARHYYDRWKRDGVWNCMEKTLKSGTD